MVGVVLGFYVGYTGYVGNKKLQTASRQYAVTENFDDAMLPSSIRGRSGKADPTPASKRAPTAGE